MNKLKLCKTCNLWKKLADDKGMLIGECRCYAPQTISGVGTGYNDQLFPHTYEYDWCGEWKEMEE